MLTSHIRQLYFTLQDLVKAVAAEPDWKAERMRDPASTFEVLVRERDLKSAQALIGYLKEIEPNDWPGREIESLARGWGDDVVKLADDWATLDARERFAVFQQVSSTLRTGLTKDVESRLR
jgi:hypothetical protein